MSIAAIEAATLRDVLRGLGHPQGGLRPALQIGEVLPARIGMDVLGHRTLMLAGVRIPAALPESLSPGQALQLRVIESTRDRLVLQVMREAPDAPAGPAAPSPAAQQAAHATAALPPYHAVPMPGGGQALLWLDPDDGAAAAGGRGDRARTMVVRYDSPEFGRLDVVLRLGGDELEASLFAPAGDPLALVRGQLPKLRAALAEAAEGRSLRLMTGGRAEDVDVRV